MPDDLPQDLRALLHDRAADAPAAPAPGPALVRRVRRRQAVRLSLAVTGGTAAVVGIVGVAALAVRPAPRAVPPAAAPSPTASPYDDRYEFCTTAPVTDVAVGLHGTEIKFDRGCYRAAAGPLRLSFTNRTAVAHNVVVHDPTGEAIAKTETVRAAGTSKAGYDSIDLGTLAAGDYSLTCDVHPQMHAQLVVR